MISRILAALGVLLVLAPGPADAAEPSKVTQTIDVTYAKPNGSELKLDIAVPAEGDGPFPAVLVIHGGAWRAGNKRDTRALLAQFAERGYVAISPQYRFCPKETFPAQVHDVKAAVRWLRSSAKRYKIDPDHIGAMGFSAGGHLAMMLGVTGPEDALEGDAPKDAPSSRVSAVVNYVGPTDLGASDIPEVSLPLVKDFLGGTAKEKPELCAKASPVTMVTKDDAPMLTFAGTKDPLVPHTQAVKLAEAMTKAGVPGRIELLVGSGHGWGGAEMDRTMDLTYKFFAEHLKPKGR